MNRQEGLLAPNVYFHSVGLWGSDIVDKHNWQLNKLSTIRNRLGHQQVLSFILINILFQYTITIHSHNDPYTFFHVAFAFCYLLVIPFFSCLLLHLIVLLVCNVTFVVNKHIHTHIADTASGIKRVIIGWKLNGRSDELGFT